MSDVLLSPTFLFRFSVPLRQHAWTRDPAALALDESYRLPSFGELEGRPLFADLRGAWAPQGLLFTVQVQGKQQHPWSRTARVEDSDLVHLWIDTRDAHNMHRASRFCHHFIFLPAGDGPRQPQPLGRLIPLNRAREHPRAVRDQQLPVWAEQQAGGYQMRMLIPAAALTGYDSEEHTRLGFTYAVTDRERGWQTLSVGPEFPIIEDPSLWSTLELVP
jgi:hypothetical protein